jgi:hypothetical protein
LTERERSFWDSWKYLEAVERERVAKRFTRLYAPLVCRELKEKGVPMSIRLPRGIRNNNPGNIRITPIVWHGEVVGDDSEFEEFDTLAHGVRAMLKLLQNYHKQGLTSIRAIVSKYAPPFENNTKRYIDIVSRIAGWSPDNYIPFEKYWFMRLVDAMCIVENGLDYISDATLEEAANELKWS